MTLIELGEISSGSSPDRPAAPPRRADIRRIAVLVVTVLCVLTVTGSARPESRGLPQLWSLPAAGDQFILTPDSLYVQASGPRTELIAYDAADGNVRWRRPASRQMYWITADVPGLVLMPEFEEREVEDENGNTFVQPTVTVTLALDPETGREVWRSTGEAGFQSGDLIQMSIWDDRTAGLDRMSFVRRSDGGVAWSADAEPGTTTWTATGPDRGQPDRLITASGNGQVVVYRVDTGAVVVRKRLPWVAPDAQPGASANLFSVGPVLYVLRDDAGRQTVDAYQPDTLRPLWSRTISTFNNYFDCGGLFCIQSGLAQVEALDPATGRVRWTSSGWDYAREISPGRLLAEPYQSGFSGLIDGTDGHRIVELAEGSTLLDRAAGRVVTIGANINAPNGAPVSQLTEDDTTIMRGVVGPVSDAGCQYAGGRLACGVTGGGLTVTDVG